MPGTARHALGHSDTRGASRHPPRARVTSQAHRALLRQRPRLFRRAGLWPAHVAVHLPKALRETRAWGPGLAPPLNQPEAHRQASISPLTKGCGADRCHRPESGGERGAARDLLSSLPERPSPTAPRGAGQGHLLQGAFPTCQRSLSSPWPRRHGAPLAPFSGLCCRPHRARG